MLQGLLSVKCAAALLCFAHLYAAQLLAVTAPASNPVGEPSGRPPYEDRFIAEPVPDVKTLRGLAECRVLQLRRAPVLG